MKDAAPADRLLAELGLQAHAMGVPLPAGEFQDAAATVEAQWRAFIDRAVGAGDLLGAHLTLRSTEGEVQVLFEVGDRIQGFRLKPQVEALEAAMPGLGWLAYQAVDGLTRHCFPIYNAIQLRWMAEYCWWRGVSTDAELLLELKAEMEWDGDQEPEDAQVRDAHPFPWPSDLVEDHDGHGWMVGMGKAPKQASRRAAQAFVGDETQDRSLRALVAAALEVLAEIGQRNHPLEGLASPQDLEDSGAWHAEDAHPCGATCYVVWDQACLMWEAIEHYETELAESSAGTTLHRVIRASTTDAAALRRALRQLKALVRRYALASRLLSHFTNEE